jgi:hypothetical protein
VLARSCTAFLNCRQQAISRLSAVPAGQESGARILVPLSATRWSDPVTGRGLRPAESPADFMACYCVNGVASPMFEAEDTAIISMYSRAKPMNMNGSTAITPAIDATVRNRKGKWT